MIFDMVCVCITDMTTKTWSFELGEYSTLSKCPGIYLNITFVITIV